MIETFRFIYSEVRTGQVKPLIHLEMDGSALGLVLSSGELVTWLELGRELRSVNRACGNNLLS